MYRSICTPLLVHCPLFATLIRRIGTRTFDVDLRVDGCSLDRDPRLSPSINETRPIYRLPPEALVEVFI